MSALAQILLLLFLPPLLLGVINKTKALFAGRRGPPLLQAYFDLFKLARKGVVLSDATTWLFQAAPVVSLVAIVGAGLLVPFGPIASPLRFSGDLVLFVALLALARFATAAAALDTGSSFEGMGAARDVTFACFAEPALVLGLLVLAQLAGTLELAGMLRAAGSWGAAAAPMALVAVGLFVVLLGETCRIPVDDPETHLELTMVHEVMVLDHSGPLLGAARYTAAVKLFVLGAVLVHVALPLQIGARVADTALFAAAMLLLAVAIGVVESAMARLRLQLVPYFLTAAVLLCGLAFLLVVR